MIAEHTTSSTPFTAKIMSKSTPSEGNPIAVIFSHTTLVGMTLILVSFFLIIILFILATNWSNV